MSVMQSAWHAGQALAAPVTPRGFNDGLPPALARTLFEQFNPEALAKTFAGHPAPSRFPVMAMTHPRRNEVVDLAMGSPGLRHALARQIGQLDRTQRDALVAQIGQETDPVRLRDGVVALLQGGAQHLQPEQRNALVHEILVMSGNDVPRMLAALQALGPSLGSIPGEQQFRLANAIFVNVTDPAAREAALHYMSQGMADLHPDVRLALVQIVGQSLEAANETGTPSTMASALCKGFEHLEPEYRELLFVEAQKVQGVEARAQVMSGFMPALEYLKKEDRETAFDAVMQSADPMRLFSSQGASVAPGRFPPAWEGLKRLDEGRLSALLAHATGDRKSATSLRAMASGMPALTDDQRQAVFDAAFDLGTAQERAQVWGSLGPSLVHMPPAQRQSMVDDIVQNLRADEQAAVLERLAPSLQLLSEKQRDTLAASLHSLPDSAAKADANTAFLAHWPGTPSSLEGLHGLPLELLQRIGGHVHSDDPRQLGKMMHAMSSTSRPLQAALSGDAAVRFLQPLTHAVTDTFTRADLPKIFTTPSARVPLALMSLQQREGMVILTSNASGISKTGWDKSNNGNPQQISMLSAMGRELQHLTPNQRTDVYQMAAVTLTPNPDGHAAVLSAMAQGGLHLLELDQREHVVRMMLHQMGSDDNVVLALKGFGPSIGKLEAHLQEKIAKGVLALPAGADREAALAHFAPLLAHMDPGAAALLADSVPALRPTAQDLSAQGIDVVFKRPPEERAEFWAGLGPKVDQLGRAHKQQMVDDIVQHLKAADQVAAMAGLGPVASQLNPEQQQALLGVATASPHPAHRAQMLAALADGWAGIAAKRLS
jgi:hypothetical protein